MCKVSLPPSLRRFAYTLVVAVSSSSADEMIFFLRRSGGAGRDAQSLAAVAGRRRWPLSPLKPAARHVAPPTRIDVGAALDPPRPAFFNAELGDVEIGRRKQQLPPPAGRWTTERSRMQHNARGNVTACAGQLAASVVDAVKAPPLNLGIGHRQFCTQNKKREQAPVY